MFAIYNSKGEMVDICEEPRYVKKNDNNVYVQTSREDADGISVRGTLYNLDGRDTIPGAPQAVVTEAEGGELILQNMDRIESVNAAQSIAFVTLAEAGSIDGVTAAEHPDLFSPWAYPVAYETGNIRRYGDRLYRCIQAHTSQADWTPDSAVSLWAAISDPDEEWPEWSQPIGAHDAYGAGDKVSHNGKRWTSNIDSNVWEPGEYGWTEASE